MKKPKTKKNEFVTVTVAVARLKELHLAELSISVLSRHLRNKKIEASKVKGARHYLYAWADIKQYYEQGHDTRSRSAPMSAPASAKFHTLKKNSAHSAENIPALLRRGGKKGGSPARRAVGKESIDNDNDGLLHKRSIDYIEEDILNLHRQKEYKLALAVSAMLKDLVNSRNNTIKLRQSEAEAGLKELQLLTEKKELLSIDELTIATKKITDFLNRELEMLPNFVIDDIKKKITISPKMSSVLLDLLEQAVRNYRNKISKSERF